MHYVKRAIVAYLLICLFMWCYQRHFMYMPETQILEPAAYGLTNFTTIPLTDSDGTHIQAWYRKARTGYPTIVYFHGNGGNMGGRINYFYQLSAEGFGIMAIDYRGYGKSEGSPSEAGFYLDARATIDYCLHTLSLKPNQMIIYGESIGTGVAVQMATEYTFGGIILQSPYTSLLALGQASYPWLPVSLLQIDRFDSLSKIGDVHVPLLLFHGENDAIVPVGHGKTIMEHAAEPKEALYFPDKGHLDMDIKVLSRAVLDFSKKYKLIKG